MSEPTFPFVDADGDADEAAPAGRRRAMLALGGLGVVALGVAGVLVLTGPDEQELDLGLPTGTAAAAATPTPSATASPSAVVPVTSRPGRDPFRVPGGAARSGSTGAGPAVVDPVAAPAAPPTQDRVVVPGRGPVVDGPAPDSAPLPGSGPREQPEAAARTVTLVRVAGDQTAVLSVDGAAQSVRVGDGFGPDGSLLLLSVQQGPDEGQWTAVVQQGAGEPFDVVTGRPVTVA